MGEQRRHGLLWGRVCNPQRDTASCAVNQHISNTGFISGHLETQTFESTKLWARTARLPAPLEPSRTQREKKKEGKFMPQTGDGAFGGAAGAVTYHL